MDTMAQQAQFQKCQEFINSLNEKISVYVNIEDCKNFVSTRSTPVLKQFSELKALTFEYADQTWTATKEQVSANEYILLVTAKLSTGLTYVH